MIARIGEALDSEIVSLGYSGPCTCAWSADATCPTTSSYASASSSVTPGSTGAGHRAQLAEALGTSQSAVNRIERGNQNISLEMIARIGEALDSEIVSLGYAGPDASARGRRPAAVRRHRRQDEQERLRRAAVRLAAQQGPYGAAPGRPHRGGLPPPGGARLHRRPHPLDQRRRRPGDRAARRARHGRHRRGGRPPHPQHHHVPRPAAAPDGPASGCRTRAAATSAPGPSSRT